MQWLTFDYIYRTVHSKELAKRAKPKMAGTGNVRVLEDEENAYTGTRVRPFASTPRQVSQILFTYFLTNKFLQTLSKLDLLFCSYISAGPSNEELRRMKRSEIPLA